MDVLSTKPSVHHFIEDRKKYWEGSADAVGLGQHLLDLALPIGMGCSNHQAGKLAMLFWTILPVAGVAMVSQRARRLGRIKPS